MFFKLFTPTSFFFIDSPFPFIDLIKSLIFFFLPLIQIIREKNKGAIEKSSQSIEKRVLIKNNRMTIKENALSVVLIEITKEIKLMNESAEGRFCRMK